VESLRILVADDHEIMRKGLRSLLETQPGWQVCGEAINGRDAVAKAAELHPDIIVLDITMPELNGLQAIPQILEASPQTEVLVLTMHESEQMMEEALRAGARGYMLKSDAMRNFLAAVEALSHHRPFLTPQLSLVQPGAVNLTDTQAIPIPSVLTAREREIMQLLAEGFGTKAVASRLKISVKTAETHRANLMRKLEIHSMSELVRYAIRNRLVEP
jgi:DNA-binding NarL/FixJ family response regulator